MNVDISPTMSGNNDMSGNKLSLHDKLQRSKRLRLQLGSDNRSVTSGNSLASPCASHEADERHFSSDPISPRSLSLEKRESFVERRRRALHKNRPEESEHTSRTSPESLSTRSGRSHEISQEKETVVPNKPTRVVATSAMFSSTTTQAERKLNGLGASSYGPSTPQKPEDKATIPTWKTMRSQIVATTPPVAPPTISRVAAIAASMDKPGSRSGSLSRGSSPAPKEPEKATLAVVSSHSQDENSNFNAPLQEDTMNASDSKSVSVASLRASFGRSQTAQLVAARNKIPTKTPHSTPDTTPLYSKPVVSKSASTSKLQFGSPSTPATPVIASSKHMGTPNSLPSTGGINASKISSSQFKSPFSKASPKSPTSTDKPTTSKSLFKPKPSVLAAAMKANSPPSKQVEATPPIDVNQVEPTPSPKAASSAFDAARYRFSDQRSPPLPKKLATKLVTAPSSSSLLESPVPPSSPKNGSAPPSWQRRNNPSPGPSVLPNTPPVSKVSPTFKPSYHSPSPTIQNKTSVPWQQRSLPPPPLLTSEESPAVTSKNVKPWQKRIANDEPPKPIHVPSWTRQPVPSTDEEKSIPATAMESDQAGPVKPWQRLNSNDELNKPPVPSWNRQVVPAAEEEQLVATVSVESGQTTEPKPPKVPSRHWKTTVDPPNVPVPPPSRTGSPFQNRSLLHVSEPTPVARLRSTQQRQQPPLPQNLAVVKSRFERTPPWVKSGTSSPEDHQPNAVGIVSRRVEPIVAATSAVEVMAVSTMPSPADSIVSALPSPTEIGSVHAREVTSPKDQATHHAQPAEPEPVTTPPDKEVVPPNTKSLVQMAADSIFASNYVEALQFESKLNGVYSLDDESQMSSLPGKVIPLDLPDDLKKALDADPPLQLPEELETSANEEEATNDRYRDISNPDPPLELPGDHSGDDSSDDGILAKSPASAKHSFPPIASSPRSDPSQKRGRNVYRSHSPSPKGWMARISVPGSPSSRTRKKEVSAEILKKMQALNLEKYASDAEPPIIFGDPVTFGAAGGEIPQQAPRIADRAKAIEDWNGGRKTPSPSVSRSPQRAIGSLVSPVSERALNFARRQQDFPPRNDDGVTPKGSEFPFPSPSDAGFARISRDVHNDRPTSDTGAPFDERNGGVKHDLESGVSSPNTAAKVRQVWSKDFDELETIEPTMWANDSGPIFSIPDVANDEFLKSVEEIQTNGKSVAAGWELGTPSQSPMKLPSDDSTNRPSSKESDDQFFPPDDPFDVSFAYSFLSSPPRSVRGDVFDPFFNEEDFDSFGGPQGFFPPAMEQEVHSTKAADRNLGDFSSSPFFPENAATPKSRGGDVRNHFSAQDKESAPVNESHPLMLPTMKDVRESPAGHVANEANQSCHNSELLNANTETAMESFKGFPGQSPRLRSPPIRPGIPRPSTPNRRKPILMRKQQQLAQAYDDNYALSLTPKRSLKNDGRDSPSKTTESNATDWDDDFNFEI